MGGVVLCCCYYVDVVCFVVSFLLFVSLVSLCRCCVVFISFGLYNVPLMSSMLLFRLCCSFVFVDCITCFLCRCVDVLWGLWGVVSYMLLFISCVTLFVYMLLHVCKQNTHPTNNFLKGGVVVSFLFTLFGGVANI